MIYNSSAIFSSYKTQRIEFLYRNSYYTYKVKLCLFLHANLLVKLDLQKCQNNKKKKFNCFRANFCLPSLLTNVYHLLGLRTKPVQLAYSYIFAREIFSKK